jgi:hypothetical protein
MKEPGCLRDISSIKPQYRRILLGRESYHVLFLYLGCVYGRLARSFRTMVASFQITVAYENLLGSRSCISSRLKVP